MRTKKLLAELLAVTVVAGGMVIAPVTAEAALAGSAKSEVFEGHTYAIFSEQMNWKDARDYCEKLGGHLVTITSAEENAFITESIMVIDEDCLIGFSDEESEGDWVWVTGEDTDYVNWEDGEPNNEWEEDFALIKNGSGIWNDGHLDVENWNFICEWDFEVDSIVNKTSITGATLDIKKTGNDAEYDSGDTDIATVSEDGIATFKKAGSVILTATADDVTTVYSVTVKNPKLNTTKVTLKPKKTYKLSISNKVGKAVFKSSNTKVAKVSSTGKITALKKGKAVITVNTNGIVLKCTVTVK